jgi:hypothetical protein
MFSLCFFFRQRQLENDDFSVHSELSRRKKGGSKLCVDDIFIFIYSYVLTEKFLPVNCFSEFFFVFILLLLYVFVNVSVSKIEWSQSRCLSFSKVPSNWMLQKTSKKEQKKTNSLPFSH